jgi:hypothetical protein
LVGWLPGWLVGWLPGWLVGCLVCLLVGCSKTSLHHNVLMTMVTCSWCPIVLQSCRTT